MNPKQNIDINKSEEENILKELENFEKNTGSQEAIEVKISADKMKCNVKVKPPIEVEKPITKEEVIKLLKSRGVIYGIDESAIEEIFTYGIFNSEVTVAKGTPPENGKDSSIEYKFDITGEGKPKLKEDEEGKVNFKELNIVESVEAGAFLAVKIPALLGKDGTNIFGEKIPALMGKDLPLPCGENTTLSEDKNAIVAEISGMPFLKDGKVCVSPVYTVKGDINYTTGNINFKGTVVIHGNVSSGFSVDATDNVEIYGNIDKAFINAGGSVFVRGGLYGLNEGKIIAKNDVTIRTVESGLIEAGNNITILQSARYSTLFANESIFLQNTKGSIIGGKTIAGKLIDVSNLGSASYTETIVEVGITPKLKETISSLNKKINEAQQKLEKILLNIKTIRDSYKGQTIPAEKEEILKKLVPTAHQLRSAIEKEQAKLQFLVEKTSAFRKGKIKVRNKVYPGVKIVVNDIKMEIRNETSHASFTEQDGQIIIGAY